MEYSNRIKREQIEQRANAIGRSIWGVQLYMSDIACLVQRRMEDQLREGIPVETVTADVCRLLDRDYTTRDEELCFWLALADLQWKHGVLMPEVKQKALEILDAGADMAFWTEVFPKRAEKRKKVLEKLHEQLLSPQPRKRTYRQPFYCGWQDGDVFSLPLKSEVAINLGFAGRYLLIRKVADGNWYPHFKVPIVHVKISDGNSALSFFETFDNAEYIQIRCTRYEDRLLPLQPNAPNWDAILEERMSKTYETDEHGMLPQYRIKLVITAKRQIPNDLRYMGNYPNPVPPFKEFVPYSEWNIVSATLQRGRESFEKDILGAYQQYTLR